jgi:hypothetical protein
MYATYPQNNTHAPQYNDYAPMRQPMPVQPGLLAIAGLAVVGAAAFGGIYLMNSSHQAEPTAAPAPSTTINLPSEISIPSLTPNNSSAPAPVIVHNPAPVRVFAPAPANQVPAPSPAPAQTPAVDQSKTDPNKGTTIDPGGKTGPTEPGKTGPTEPGKTGPTEPGKTGPTEPGKTGPTEPGPVEIPPISIPSIPTSPIG